MMWLATLQVSLALLLAAQPATACFSQSHLYQRHESSSRQRSSHAFAYGEYQPKTSELAIQASGLGGEPVRHSGQLLRSGSDLLLFSGRRSRFMTRRCKEKLEQLALLVRNQWNGHVRIRVHQAWMPKQDALWDSQVGHHGLESLHFSGRAVDMSLVIVQHQGQRYRDVNLGRLAQIAYYQAYFDYCKVLRDTVHCSVKSDDPLDSDWLACFPAAATVVKRNHDNNINSKNATNIGDVVPIDSLKQGDEILTIDDVTGGTQFTRVVGYHHKLDSGQAVYTQIRLANGQQLEVSPNHLVFASDPASDPSVQSVYADSVRPGQMMLAPHSGGWIEVVHIARARRQGMYAPITAAGHLLVDGVWVSSYAHTRYQRFAHALFAPLRWLDYICRGSGQGLIICGVAMETGGFGEAGLHWYSSWLHSMAKLLAPGSVMFPN